MEKREWKIVAKGIKDMRRELRKSRYTISGENILYLLEIHLAAEICELCDGPPVEEFLKVSRER